MVRVLQVVTYMGRGGLETMIMNYYRNIDRTKIQFDFLVHRDFRADYDDEIESLGGCIYRLPQLVPWSIKYRRALDDFFKQHKEYKIVHVHQDCLSSIILKAAYKNGVPCRIAHSHSSSQDKNLKYAIKMFYKQFIAKYATKLFACGKEAGDWMFNGADYSILNNAIDAEKYVFNPKKRDDMRKELRLDKQFTLGLVGRFSYPKNHTFLLDIFKVIVSKEPLTKLILIGDGDLRDEIEAKIRELKLEENVIITGVRTDIPDLLQAMDVFVMPSNYEGLSLAIVEAQAAGLPCFISDKVPIECKKTDLVKQLSLSDGPAIWAEEILKTKNAIRKNTYTEIALAGFDIEKNAIWLQEFYMQNTLMDKGRQSNETDSDDFYSRL